MVNEYVVIAAKGVQKAKASFTIEPFDLGRYEFFYGFVKLLDFPVILFKFIRSIDLENLGGLDSTGCPLGQEHDLGSIRDRTLSEISQHVDMKQDILLHPIGDDKAEPPITVEPLDVSVQC